MENPEFKKIQNGSTQQSIVPTIHPISQPIQPISPLLSIIVRPANTNTNYSMSGNIDRHSAMEPGGDICSMRIISRPK